MKTNPGRKEGRQKGRKIKGRCDVNESHRHRMMSKLKSGKSRP